MTRQVKILFLVAFVLLTLGFCMLYWGILISSQVIKCLGYGFFGGSLGLAALPYLKYIRSSVTIFPTLEGIVNEQLGIYVKTLNTSIIQRGLYWNIVPGYFWLELHIDKMVLKHNSLHDKLISFETKLSRHKSIIIH